LCVDHLNRLYFVFVVKGLSKKTAVTPLGHHRYSLAACVLRFKYAFIMVDSLRLKHGTLGFKN